MIASLLSRVSSADIVTEPFPHVCIPDALPADLYAQLAAHYPGFDRIGWAGDRAPASNHRFQLSAWPAGNMPNMAPVWRNFLAYHASSAFFAQVVALFADHWPAALIERCGGSLLGHPMGLILRDRPSTGMIVQDARFEINTPVTGPASVSRGCHLDIPERLFTGLFYMRANDDTSRGGDLQLFRWRDAPTDITAFEQPDHAVEAVLTIPYRANQLVLFPQSINALHGVSMRHPTAHTRRYVFVTAELDRPWLATAA